MGVAGRGLRESRGLLRAFATATSGTAIMSLLGGVAGVIAARALGPYQRGLLATAVVWSGVLASIVAVGVPEAAAYFVGRERARRAQFASSALALAALTGLGLAVAGVLVSQLVGGDAKLPLTIAFATGLPVLVNGTGIGAILGTGKFRLWTILRIIQPAIALVGVIAVVLLDRRTAAAVATVTAIAATSTLVIVLGALRRRGLLGRPTRTAIEQVFSYGWRNVLSGVAWLVSYKLDQLVLSIAVSPALLGLYAVAASFGEILVPTASSTGRVMLSRVAARGPDEVRDSLRLAVGACVTVSGGLALIVFVFAPFLVRILFGSEFADAVTPLRILLPGAVALATTVVLADTIRGLGRPLVPARAELIGALCTGVLLAILVPPLGIEGAAIASTVSYSVVTVCMAASLRKTMREASAP